MWEGREVTRQHATEIPYLLDFFPSLRAASDRTLSVYFGIRADAYDARFYEGELNRIVEKHWHKLSDEDRDVVDRELPGSKGRRRVLRRVACPAMPPSAAMPTGARRLIRPTPEPEDRLAMAR